MRDMMIIIDMREVGRRGIIDTKGKWETNNERVMDDHCYIRCLIKLMNYLCISVQMSKMIVRSYYTSFYSSVPTRQTTDRCLHHIFHSFQLLSQIHLCSQFSLYSLLLVYKQIIKA